MSILLFGFRLGGGMMERVSREMTFEEEYTFLKKEAKELFDKEDKESEPPESHSVVRRALRCIKKLVTEVKPYKEYKDLEEQGLLLRLPCRVGDIVYCICERYTKCSEYGQVLEEYPCQGCECLECDSHKELYVQPQKAYTLDWIVSNLKRFGKTVFLTKKEAEQKLKEMEVNEDLER